MKLETKIRQYEPWEMVHGSAINQNIHQGHLFFKVLLIDYASYWHTPDTNWFCVQRSIIIGKGFCL